MPHSITFLLRRNLHDVFGEGDPTRRRATIDAIFAADAAFYAPDGSYHGRDAIDRIARDIRATHPDFRYAEIGEPEELAGCAGRIRWVSGPPGQPPVYAGTDFILVRDGRITGVYLFFDAPGA
ncbi:nuclear transport factor 2 family protein [Sphingomonas sp. AR_OL41]|uniref:nuclear transport factor 2 family protein n=1 Tax=Sphingomonas sp. AR_OL41 TaxID=3042729 RepID=UPI0024813AB3|nr:nuclear transport factor 2 family protein [Sphingomonas sp. AR_OL41]MDH7972852.1 nuclear transport factor 2 family protein [Sphingomonas sp. AR_OL41]